jgi:hypothetical protein
VPALADTTRSESETLTLEKLAFPQSQRWPLLNPAKWPEAIHFVVAAENEDDAALAVGIINHVRSQLPAAAQQQIVVDEPVSPLAAVAIRGKSVVYIADYPYEDLAGPLRPMFHSLWNENTDVV